MFSKRVVCSDGMKFILLKHVVNPLFAYFLICNFSYNKLDGNASLLGEVKRNCNWATKTAGKAGEQPMASVYIGLQTWRGSQSHSGDMKWCISTGGFTESASSIFVSACAWGPDGAVGESVLLKCSLVVFSGALNLGALLILRCKTIWQFVAFLGLLHEGVSVQTFLVLE